MEYELFEVHIEGMEPFMSNGLDVKDKDEVKRVTHGGSHEAIDFIWGDHNIDFSILDPKDHASLYEARRISRENRRTFTIICMSRDRTGELVPIHRLDGCVFGESGRQMKAKEEIKVTISGMAMKSSTIRTQYA